MTNSKRLKSGDIVYVFPTNRFDAILCEGSWPVRRTIDDIGNGSVMFTEGIPIMYPDSKGPYMCITFTLSELTLKRDLVATIQHMKKLSNDLEREMCVSLLFA